MHEFDPGDRRYASPEPRCQCPVIYQTRLHEEGCRIA